MQKLIESITKENEIDFLPLEHELFKVFFGKPRGSREDYFFYIFSTYENLNSYSESAEDFGYALNSLIIDLQNALSKSELDLESIKRNSSLILVLEVKNPDNLVPLKKAEENYLVVKKYILTYKKEEVDELQEYLTTSPGENLNLKLSNLAMNKSSLLDKPTENSWYLLLMRLFIKIPYLNYFIQSEHKNVLGNVEEIISNKLSSENKLLLNAITEKFNPETMDVEDFINQIDFLENKK